MKNKVNIIIPLAGKGSRMQQGGLSLAKPLLIVGNKTILQWGTDSISIDDSNLIFVVRRDHVTTFSIDKFLETTYQDHAPKIVISETETEGSLSTCLLAKKYIDNSTPLVVFCPDVAFSPVFCPISEFVEDEKFDGLERFGKILTFKANSPNYSYVCKDKNGWVTKTAEKQVISEDASVGVYCFSSGSDFVSAAESVINKKEKTGNEYYIAPLYNELLKLHDYFISTERVENMFVMGTPEEFNFFKEAIAPYIVNDRKVILCCDHSGFAKKKAFIDFIEGENYSRMCEEPYITWIDVGCYSERDCDYTEFVNSAVDVHRSNPGSVVLAFCRSGNGVCISANKHKGIRSVLVSNTEQAKLGIEHNAANCFAISAGSFPDEEIEDFLDVIKSARFQGGRHQNRLQKLKE